MLFLIRKTGLNSHKGNSKLSLTYWGLRNAIPSPLPDLYTMMPNPCVPLPCSNSPTSLIQFKSLIPLHLHPQPIPDPILPAHHHFRQRITDAQKHKRRPLPSERVDCDAEDEPIDQFRVREEVEGAGRSASFQVGRHVDPALHPVFLRSSCASLALETNQVEVSQERTLPRGSTRNIRRRRV